MTDFKVFASAVEKQFNKMTKDSKTKGLFQVEMERNELFDLYLASFPEGTNPIFKERTQHDCNCCKGFIRGIGNAVTIENGKMVTIWDIDLNDETYQPVADALAAHVRTKKIVDLYVASEKRVGKSVTRTVTEDDTLLRWDHFEVTVPKEFIPRRSSVASAQGDFRTTKEVFERTVKEITKSAIDTVSDLIQEKSLYRGAEHKPAVDLMKRYNRDYNASKNPDLYVWETAYSEGKVCRIRNSVIGTLLVDLSEGRDLEGAVESFEDKVAPANYKRPKALVTQKMIDQASKKIEELGLEDSLERRYAVETDISVNDVLFADRSIAPKMKNASSVLGDLEPTKKKKVTGDKAIQITPDQFVNDILPKAETVEAFVENKMTSSFASIIAPVHDDAPLLTKWDNNFTWSYNGEFTDSVVERVKSAGGNVSGEVRVSLSWFNYDDLDIHVVTPRSEIYFGNRRVGNGALDVDMNAGGRSSREAVENVTWDTIDKMPDGAYTVVIHNFSKRESIDVGFNLQVQIGSDVSNYSYPLPVDNNKKVVCMKLHVKGTSVRVELCNDKLESDSKSKNVWGVDTQDFVRVNMISKSPAYWGGKDIGNDHLFFILDGCENPDTSRGFYNEFLRDELHDHRKVFELLGSKMKVPHSKNQLSGLGFSSTQKKSVLLRVTSGNQTLLYKLNF